MLSAWVAGECKSIPGQEFTGSEERVHADLSLKAKVRGLDVWGQFKVFPPVMIGAQAEDSAETRRALTWKAADGVKTAKARLAAMGSRHPDLREENADITGCVSPRSPHLQLISLGAPEKWPIDSLDIKDALLQAGGFDREVHLGAPCEWNSQDTRRVSKLRAPANGHNDAPAACHRSLREYLVNSVDSPSRAGLRFEVSSVGPGLCNIFREFRGAVVAIAAHTDDNSGCGQPDLLSNARPSLGGEIWGAEGPGRALCTRGHGLGPEEGLLGDADPGGLYGEPETPPHITRTVGRLEESFAHG